MNTLKITKVDNGYFFEGSVIMEDGVEEKISWVIEDSDEDELKAPETLLYDIMDYFGFAGSKHDAERIQIVREKNGVLYWQGRTFVEKKGNGK